MTHRHGGPLRQLRREILRRFEGLGFNVVQSEHPAVYGIYDKQTEVGKVVTYKKLGGGYVSVSVTKEYVDRVREALPLSELPTYQPSLFEKYVHFDFRPSPSLAGRVS